MTIAFLIIYHILTYPHLFFYYIKTLDIMAMATSIVWIKFVRSKKEKCVKMDLLLGLVEELTKEGKELKNSTNFSSIKKGKWITNMCDTKKREMILRHCC